MVKRQIIRLLESIDALLALLVYPSAWMLAVVRRVGIEKLPWCRRVLERVGVYPLLDHYYEPQFNFRDLKQSLSTERRLPGIDWNIPGQLEMLNRLTFADELAGVPENDPGTGEFYFRNLVFESGDAEYWYQIIRAIKPRRLFEIGSGFSTLLAVKSIRQNLQDDGGHRCKHVCIEPFENPWLEATGVTVLREKVEDVEMSMFDELEENDILFIDSSHMIRPQGDVVFEYLELLPSLKAGVIVHFHDIFSPRNYPEHWLRQEVKFWNEQYLLEAFLTHNGSWKILGALNYLSHHHFDRLKCVAPSLLPGKEPGSFYIQRVA